MVLTRVWRQSDVHFAGVLNSIRFGDNAAAARLARDCSRPLPEREGIKPTQASLIGTCLCIWRSRLSPGLTPWLPVCFQRQCMHAYTNQLLRHFLSSF